LTDFLEEKEEAVIDLDFLEEEAGGGSTFLEDDEEEDVKLS
jgi:hypothetical protein